MNNGGPAFPTPPASVWDGDTESIIGEQPGAPGMTLRDYFAAAALNGLCNTGFLETVADWAERVGEPSPYQMTTVIAYAMADHMLAERAK